MDECLEGDPRLQRLLQLQSSRPTFARMVSWEFGRHNYNTPSRTKRGDKTKAEDSANLEKELSDSDSYSSDSSVYFSAEEFPEDVVLKSSDSVGVKNRSRSGKAEEGRCNSTETAPQSERRRRPSKKQRKEKRRKFRLEHVDHAIPFKNVENLAPDMLYEHVQESVTKLRKQVPSLVEICMKKNHSNTKTSTADEQTRQESYPRNIPHILQKRSVEQKSSLAMTSLQLSWLHRLLSVHDSLFCGSNKQVHTISKLNKKSVAVYTYPTRPLRNLWTLHCEITPHRTGRPEEVLARLLRNLPDLMFISNEREVRNEHIIWSHLAQCVDLMLPSTITNSSKEKTSKKHEQQPEEEAVEGAMTTATVRVKRALKLRYPNLMEVMFEDVLPYALWARGQLKKAAGVFLKLSERPMEDHVTYRAVQLNEAGRMYAQFGEVALARKMFLMAAELCSANVSDGFKQKLTGQAMMLVANLTDTGVFSPDKAAEAGSAWDAVLHLYTVPEFSQDAALISLLCFHCGDYSGSSWLNLAKTKVKVWAEEAPHLFLYLSMIHALCGEQNQSELTYKEFAFKNRLYEYNLLPGTAEDGRSLRQRLNSTPWKPLVDVVRKEGLIPLIKILWRAQLLHPTFSHQSESGLYVTDTCAMDLHLRITDEGYLSGNLQMMLPPMRSIHLDPFTGSVVFPAIPVPTEVWCLGRSTNPNHGGTFPDHVILPVKRRLFEDEGGKTVDLLVTSNLNFCMNTNNLNNFFERLGTQTATLFWQCPLSGQKLKLDIRKKLRQHMYQCIRSRICEEVYNKYAGLNPEEHRQVMLEALDVCLSQGWELSYKTVCDVTSRWLDIEKNCQRAEAEGDVKRVRMLNKKRKTNKLTSLSINPFTLHVSHHVQVGNLLVLHMCTLSSFHGNDILLIINCSSSETFVNPVILNEPASEKWPLHWNLCIPCANSNRHGNKGEIIGVYKSNKYPRVDDMAQLQFYNSNAEFLYEVDTARFDSPPPNLTTIRDDLKGYISLGKKLYGIHPDKTRLVCNHLTHSTLSSVYFPLILSLEIVGHHLLITTEEGVIIACPETLEPLDIQVKMKRTCILTVGDMGGYTCIKGQYHTVVVVQEKALKDTSSENSCVTRAAVALNSVIVLVELSKNRADITLAVELPGTPREVHFISEQVGFLVTASLHRSEFAYLENLYHLDYHGKILGLLPCLGVGPRSFFSFYHHGGDWPRSGQDLEVIERSPGWYVYLRDGHGGLCCFKLTF